MDGAPFLLLRDLAALARRIAGARRSRPPRVEAVLAGAGRARVRVVVDLGAGTLAAGSGPRSCPPLLLARALLQAALDLCGAALARSPRQARNPYVSELQRDSAEALRHVEELAGGDRLAAAGAPLRARSARLPREPLAPGRMRRVAYRCAWQADVGSPAGRGLLRAGELVIAAGAAAIVALDIGGAERWRAEGATWAERTAGLLLVRRDGAIAAHELGSGRLRWSRATELPRAAAALSGGPIVLATGSALSALDPASGRVCWRFEAPAARLLQLGGFGRLALAAGDTGVLYAVDAAGRVAWRLHLPGPAVSAPQPLGGDALVLCSTTLGGALVRCDAATGRRRFEAALDFTPSPSPAVSFAGLVAVCGTEGGDPVVAAVDDSGALAWTDAAPLPGPLSAGAVDASLIVKTAGGACAALDRRGAVVWSAGCEAAHPPPSNLPPIAARRVVFVPGDQVTAFDAATGAELGAAHVGAPVRLLVGADLALHGMDAEGLVLAARLATHLSVL